MKDDKLCISPDALIAMIVTEAQDVYKRQGVN